MFAFIGSLIAGALGLFGGAASAVGTVGGAALSTIGTAGGAVLSTAGTLGGGVLGLAGGGLKVLGGVPAATAKTTDYLSTLTPTIAGGVQMYQSLKEKEPGPADYRASGAAPAQPAPMIPLFSTQRVAAGPPEAQPNYLLYAGIALAAIVLLRGK